MQNVQIFFIVFGSSGTIIVILIFIFKWLNLMNKKNDEFYKIDEYDVELKV